MSHTADPLERLRAANPVPSLPTVDWEHVQQHVSDDARRPRDRRTRLLAIGGASCAAMLALAAIAVLLLSSAFSPSRAPSPTAGCDHVHTSCLGSLQVGALAPLPNPNATPAAAHMCAVISPRCARGCVLSVAGPLRSSLGLATPGREDLLPEHARGHNPSAARDCTAKTAEPCLEDVAGAGTRPPTGKAVRELLSTERLLEHAAPPGNASPPVCERLFFRDLDLPAKRFPHRTRKRH